VVNEILYVESFKFGFDGREKLYEANTIHTDRTIALSSRLCGMWRVDFWTLDMDGNRQSVYLNGNGLTCYIVYGES